MEYQQSFECCSKWLLVIPTPTNPRSTSFITSEENSFEELKLAPEVISETQEVQQGDKVGYMDDYPLDPLTAHEKTNGAPCFPWFLAFHESSWL